MSSSVQCQYVQTKSGRIHIATAGVGFPVLMLHQTPRSWDEFKEVLPLLASKYRVIAMDTPGFGASEPLPVHENTIERWAIAGVQMLDELGIGQFAVVGHHTGAATAHEIAASHPERVRALVMSSAPLPNEAGRKARIGKKHVVDEVEPASSGAHLQQLWTLRQPFYPEGDIDLLERFVIDFLRAGSMGAEGHKVSWRYEMEKRSPLVTLPTLLIAATQDPVAYPRTAGLKEMLPHAEVVEIEGGMVPMPNQMPHEYANAIDAFLSRQLSTLNRP